MGPKYRCPNCKRWLEVHWAERTEPLGLAFYSIEATVLILLIATGTLHAGHLLETWQVVAILGVAGVVAYVVYYHFSRRIRRYVCAPCDKVYRGDYLRSVTKAAQTTQIAS